MSEYTSESLSLLISYLQLIGVWITLPTTYLIVQKDRRSPYFIALLCVTVISLVVAYSLQWKVLFPRPASMINYDKNKNEN